jgi:alpha-1,3-rhamnosyl/mannosyltransferase
MFRRQSVVAPTILFQDVISNAPADGDTLQELAKTIEPGTRYVVYNGGFEARKNVFVLVEGFGLARQAYPDLHLVLMGGGYEPLRPGIQSLDLERAVILTGFVSEELKAAILQRAIALIYPSLYEGFGLPVLEGFANGVPVVTSPNGSLKEVAGDAALYISDPSDPACVAAAIARIQDSDVRAVLRDAGTARWRSYDAQAVRDLVVAELRATLVT